MLENAGQRRMDFTLLVGAGFLILLSMVVVSAPLNAQGLANQVVLHNFQGWYSQGAYPLASVVRDAAGTIYGSTFWGGEQGEGPSTGLGVIFKIDTTGRETVLHRFTGNADGAFPNGVTLGADGSIYGSTQGNAHGAGTIFKVDAQGKYSVLYSFGQGQNSAKGTPGSAVTLDGAGNIYGTTQYGAPSAYIYKLDTSGSLKLLHPFPQNVLQFSAVTLDSGGNVYGTAVTGGTNNAGFVYKLTPNGTYSVLHNFGTAGDGKLPVSGVTLDGAGNLYGTTSGGDRSGSYKGVLYKLDATNNEIILQYLTDGSDADVVFDKAGNLYGATFSYVYELSLSGQFSVLYVYPPNVPTEEFPPGLAHPGVILDGAGHLFGTLEFGGTDGIGSVFEVGTTGATTLYSFPEGYVARGANPASGVILDRDGNLYGTTASGGLLISDPGEDDGHRCGVLYKLDSTGKETVLYSFEGGSSGCVPTGGVIRDSEGNFYGAAGGGPETDDLGDGGIVYRVDPSGTETVLYSFRGQRVDGARPSGSLVRDEKGNFYGTTLVGGEGMSGIVYKLDALGNENVLLLFNYNGATPEGVIRDSAGNLYGVCYNTYSTGVSGASGPGLVYKLDPSGNQTVLYMFSGGADGGGPLGLLVRDTAGNLYGVTKLGGAYGSGVIYRVDPSGVETVVYNFTGGLDGGSPLAGMIRDAAGDLFGTTNVGGNDGYGVVYKLDTTGKETVLYSFTGPDGQFPASNLVADSAGNVYGTTTSGGLKQGGVVFKLSGPASPPDAQHSASKDVHADEGSPAREYLMNTIGGPFAR